MKIPSDCNEVISSSSGDDVIFCEYAPIIYNDLNFKKL